jgi:hypothetical protein
MDKLKDKEVPIGALATWMYNVEGKDFFAIKIDGTMHDSLKILNQLGGTTIVKNLRHSKYHMREIQKLLILGLIEQISKDCSICSGRDKSGSNVVCLGIRKKCAARHLYAITVLGLKALEDLQKQLKIASWPKHRFSYSIRVQINPHWFQYFKNVVW